MKQIIQNLKTGVTELADVPCPQVKSGYILIQSNASVVSLGTERMLVDFGKANILQKARQQPDKVRQVIGKIKTDGLMPTISAVRTKLDQPMPLGYCNAGTVIAIGKGVEGFSVGDRVISNGPHAEVVCVPQNLCARIPDNVVDEEAAFTIMASIALQGIRLSQPSIGECFAVIGLGLVGLLTVQLLIAQGCQVIGIDFDSKKVEIAKQFGAEGIDLSKGEDPVARVYQFTKSNGVDGVLITASTKSNGPIHQAAQMCRKRGRVVLIGVTGLELQRDDFYKKEISFQVSCSYGPGRYDPNYEEKGNDYPYGYVRWTEQRNFEAVLELMRRGSLNIQSLITHRFPFDQAVKAYDLVSEGKTALGIILNYVQGQVDREIRNTKIDLAHSLSHISPETGRVAIGMIGAGNFTNQILLPAIKKTKASLKIIASSGGVSGMHVGRRHQFSQTTTNTDDILNDSSINTVFITTRHNTHAKYAMQALKAGKHVFLEKPLCITREELFSFQNIDLPKEQVFMVGFNRRFAPHTKKIKQLLNAINEPKCLVMTVNAGNIPADHWIQDREVGGGRVIGEVCHFVDLLKYLVGYKIVNVNSTMLGSGSIENDRLSITLKFEDGSIGTIHYFANGHKSYPKEKLEVFAAGKILALDNFRKLYGYGFKNFNKMKLWSQDKGHNEGVSSFIHAIENSKESPIPIEDIIEVTATTFDILENIKINSNRRF